MQFYLAMRSGACTTDIVDRQIPNLTPTTIQIRYSYYNAIQTIYIWA